MIVPRNFAERRPFFPHLMDSNPDTAETPDAADSPEIELKQVIEALLLASPEPLRSDEIVDSLRGAAKRAIEEEAERAEKLAKAAEKAGKGNVAPPDDEDAGEAEPRTEGDAEGDDGDGVAPGSATGRPELAFAEIIEEEVTLAIRELNADYAATGRAFKLLERAEGWKLFTRAPYAPWLKQLFPDKKPERLSAPALETLAIIAYRQPITKAAIEAVRGVSVDGVMQKLLDRNIVRIAGRADLPGRPLLYETTELFFEHFGIRSVDDLPNSAELRAARLPEPEAEKPVAEEPAGEGGESGDTQGELPAEQPAAAGVEPGDPASGNAGSAGVVAGAAPDGSADLDESAISDDDAEPAESAADSPDEEPEETPS